MIVIVDKTVSDLKIHTKLLRAMIYFIKKNPFILYF